MSIRTINKIDEITFHYIPMLCKTNNFPSHTRLFVEHQLYFNGQKYEIFYPTCVHFYIYIFSHSKWIYSEVSFCDEMYIVHVIYFRNGRFHEQKIYKNKLLLDIWYKHYFFMEILLIDFKIFCFSWSNKLYSYSLSRREFRTKLLLGIGVSANIRLKQ